MLDNCPTIRHAAHRIEKEFKWCPTWDSNPRPLAIFPVIAEALIFHHQIEGKRSIQTELAGHKL